MIIELAEKKIVDVIKEKLETFKKIEAEDVKEAVKEIESAIKDYDTAKEEIEVKKEDPVSEKQEQSEEKQSEESKEEKTEEPKEEIKSEEKEKPKEKELSKKHIINHKISANEVELSLQVAKKLKEAALELEKKDTEIATAKEKHVLELKARDEIIDGYKNKFVELQSIIKETNEKLANYKKKEELELAKQKQELKKDLIELYANLNMSKTIDDFNAFGMTQLVELRKALEVTLEKKNSPVRETVKSIALQKAKETQKEDLTAKETFEGMFGQNPDMY